MEIVFRPESQIGSSLAIKLFDALTLIRKTYGLEIYMRIETSMGYTECVMGCGPPKIHIGSNTVITLEEPDMSVESLANLIVNAIFEGKSIVEPEYPPISGRRKTPMEFGVIAS